VLDQLTRGGGADNFGHDLSGVRLVAEDLDWTFGSGAEMTAPAGDLALYICNRRVNQVAAGG
jgi:hypothetical protein